MDKELIIENLRKLEKKEEVIKILDSNASSVYEKIKLLNEAMYNPEKFYSSGSLSEAEELELELDIFEIGDWRLAELYEKLRS